MAGQKKEQLSSEFNVKSEVLETVAVPEAEIPDMMSMLENSSPVKNTSAIAPTSKSLSHGIGGEASKPVIDISPELPAVVKDTNDSRHAVPNKQKDCLAKSAMPAIEYKTENKNAYRKYVKDLEKYLSLLFSYLFLGSLLSSYCVCSIRAKQEVPFTANGLKMVEVVERF